MALVKAIIINTYTGEPIPVMFNPEQYTLSRSAKYTDANVKGLESPIPEWGYGSPEVLSMDLFFDTYESGLDVRLFTERIAKLLDPDETAKKDEPPPCLFVWGTLTFKCRLESITKKFTMFNPLGMPVRATLSVTFRGYNELDVLLAKNPFRSLGHTKTYIVKDGDRLDHISWKVYDESGLWKKIADANNIENPRELESGRVLIIPPAD